MVDFDAVRPHALDEEVPGGVVINPHSALGKELRKWEQHHSHLVPRGTNPGNPYVYREFPKMLYRAQKLPNGQTACMQPAPDPYAYDRMDRYSQACLMVDSFNRSCTRVVADASEEAIAKGQGWANSVVEAMAVWEKDQQAIGNAAAEAAYAVQRMSEKARTEHAAAEAETHQHVTDVVGTPKARRGRPPKARPVVADEAQEHAR